MDWNRPTALVALRAGSLGCGLVMTGRQKIAWAVTAAVVVMLAWLLHESWADIIGVLTGANWHFVVAAIVVLSLGNVQVGILFAAIVKRCSGDQIETRPVLGIFLVSQVAKYVPGRIWGVAMQAGMLRVRGSTAALVAANVELAALVIAVVSGVGLACLAGWSTGWLAGALAMLATFAATAAMLKLGAGGRCLRLVDRWIPWGGRVEPSDGELETVAVREPSTLQPAAFAGLAVFILLYLLGWGLMAASVAGVEVQQTLAIVAVMSLSYIVGTLSMLPGGLGAREGAMLLLAPTIGLAHEDMATLALASRAVLLIVDAVTAAGGAWLLRSDYF